MENLTPISSFLVSREELILGRENQMMKNKEPRKEEEDQDQEEEEDLEAAQTLLDFHRLMTEIARRHDHHLHGHNNHGHSGFFPRMTSRLMGLVDKNESSTWWEKTLRKSDVTDGQGRLLLRSEFVKKLKGLLKEGEKPQAGIPVTVYNSHLEEYKMVYKCWVKNKEVDILTSGWNIFFHKNHLEEGQNILVWAFRHVSTQKLCFSITVIQRDRN